MDRPSATEMLSAFSQYMSLPAWQAITAITACQYSGVAMTTASTSGRASTSRKSR